MVQTFVDFPRVFLAERLSIRCGTLTAQWDEFFLLETELRYVALLRI
jgi:hypothetical protein